MYIIIFLAGLLIGIMLYRLFISNSSKEYKTSKSYEVLEKNGQIHVFVKGEEGKKNGEGGKGASVYITTKKD